MDESVEQKPIVFRLAPVWKRGVARLIDYLLINLVIGIPLRLAMRSLGLTGSLFGSSPWFFSFFGYQSLVRTAVGWAYEAYFLTTTGQTIGKMILGIMVVSERGRIIGLNKALVRLASGFVPLEFVLCLITARKQCLHDLLAQTTVVDKQK